MQERDARQVHDQQALYGGGPKKPDTKPAKATNQTPPPKIKLQPVEQSPSTTQGYGHWTEPPFSGASPDATASGAAKKKQGALRWIDPDWSIVRWVKNLINDEDEDQKHHQRSMP